MASGDTAPLKDYHFDLGNSTVGPIGFCAVVRASSREEALDVLGEALPEEIEVDAGDDRVVYLNVYFNANAVSVRDIDDEQEAEVTVDER